MKIGFDNDKYLELQAQHIREHKRKLCGHVYLKFAGKLFHEHQASRVLPGFPSESNNRLLSLT